MTFGDTNVCIRPCDGKILHQIFFAHPNPLLINELFHHSPAIRHLINQICQVAKNGILIPIYQAFVQACVNYSEESLLKNL